MGSGKLAQLRSTAKREGWLKYVITENDERALLEGYRVNLSRGLHVVKFFSDYLRHSQGQWAGKPFIPADFQREGHLIPLFGWERPDGRRRFNRASIWEPKKSGKSTEAAAICCYGLVGEDEPGAKIFCLANSRDQIADSVIDECANMVEASDALSAELTVRRSTYRILRNHTSYIRALSAEDKSSEGKNAYMWVIDEIHKFDERGRLLRESMRYAGRTRREPLEIVISTAGDDDSGVGKEEYDEAKQILDGPSKGGIVDLHTFAFIAAADQKDDWKSPVTWRKANPAIGVTITEEKIREECEEAIARPRLVNVFKRYCLNLWTSSDTTFLDMEKWRDCADQATPEAALIGMPCYGGLDLSSTTDLSCLAWVFLDGKIIHVRPRFWLPKDNIKVLGAKDRCDYEAMAEAGLLELTPGRTIDYTYIEKCVAEENKLYKAREVGYDEHQARDIAGRLIEKHNVKMIVVPQNFDHLSAPTKRLEALVLNGELRHDDNPIMNRMAAQTSAISNVNGDIRPVKNDRFKRRKRIDGIVAVIIALSRAILGGGKRQEIKGDFLTWV